MSAPASNDEIRAVNARYHDGAAAGYDAKWGIDFGPAGQTQVVAKLRKALRATEPHFTDSLEIGAGTGYFSLNLLQAGVIENASCTDISEGMVATLRANAERLDLTVGSRVSDASALPFGAASFDLVLGHAVLHHLPDLDRAFVEMHRVLRPGGTIVFAGEPSRCGDQFANIPKRAAAFAAPLWRRAIHAKPSQPGHSDGGAENHQLEGHVDVHAFLPAELKAHAVGAGFTNVHISGEELLANWFGWTSRTLEASADPDTVPFRWKQFAYKGYLALQKADAPLERALPAAGFYNLLLSATKPA